MEARKKSIIFAASTFALAALTPVFAAQLASAKNDHNKSEYNKANEYMKPNIKHDQYGDMKIVVPITTSDVTIQGMKLRNLSNSLEAVDKWGGKLDATVVLYGKGLSLLKNPSKATRSQIDALKDKGVQIEVCNNSLEEQGINFHDLYHVTEQDIVPSGFAEVAFLQASQDYVVDPVN